MAASSASSSDDTESRKQQQSKPNTNISPVTTEEDFGFFFFPDRDGPSNKSFFQRAIFQGDKNHFKCKVNVQNCMKNNPNVKLLMAALKSHGCPVKLNRHISCEPCKESVSGGFDPTTMQVVICENNVRKQPVTCNVIAHELLHAFDFCRAKVDFQNLRHLACTEIRAANMNHCSLSASLAMGDASILDFKGKHQYCVRNKALQSVMLVRNVTEQEAMSVIDDVFDKCYNDTEPYGRRCFKDLDKANRAYEEARYYYDID